MAKPSPASPMSWEAGEQGHWSQTAWVQIPVLAFSSCATPGKEVYLSEPQFLYLLNGHNTSTDPRGLGG